MSTDKTKPLVKSVCKSALKSSATTCVPKDLSMGHDWPVEKAMVDLPVGLKKNLKRTSGNLLSLLKTQIKDLGAAFQTLLAG